MTVRRYDMSDLERLLTGKGITDIPPNQEPAGILLVPCADQRLAGGGVAEYGKYDHVYDRKPFVRCVEGPVQVFSKWDEVHVNSLLHSFEFFKKEKGIDTLAIDAHSECAALPADCEDVDQLVLMIKAFRQLRAHGFNDRIIGSFTKIMPGRWKTLILFDTVQDFPEIAAA